MSIDVVNLDQWDSWHYRADTYIEFMIIDYDAQVYQLRVFIFHVSKVVTFEIGCFLKYVLGRWDLALHPLYCTCNMAI